MKPANTNTEQAILEAAEKEFIEKGYERTKTTQIARMAGVTHAMLHYYYKTKENLFNVIFERKVMDFSGTFILILEENIPFQEKLKQGIEAHFDLLGQNPHLPSFVYNEIIQNEERKLLFKKLIYPRIRIVIEGLSKEMEKEVKAGNIRYRNPWDLLMNIMSLNLFAHMFAPIADILKQQSETDGSLDHIRSRKEFLEHRKQNNVRIILQHLKP